MGPQWWAMGQELYASEPIYRAAVDEADAIFQEISGFSILAEMLKDEESSQITRTEFAQPANLIIQIGLLAVLGAAGIEPGAVVGHSVGELASAYAAGVLSLRDVLTVSYHRSRLQATCAGTGAMMAVALSKDKALERIAHCLDRVSIGAVNGPGNVTLAGDAAELEQLAVALQAEDIFHRRLEVEVPYHSPMMEPIMAPLAEALATVQPNQPLVPLYSTVTGSIVTGIAYGADYWPANTRQSVEFATAIGAILNDGYSTFLEVGPHPVLATSLRDCIKLVDKDCRTAYTLRRKTPERSALHRSIMTVYTSGCQIDWTVHNGTGNFIELPNYAWQRERFWLENERGIEERISPIQNPILGLQSASAAPVWRNDLDHQPLVYLRDHVVTGMPILPAAAYIEALLELGKIQFEDAAAIAVRDLQILAPMIITPDRALDVVTDYEPLCGSATIRSIENGRAGLGQLHITAKLAGLQAFQPQQVNLSECLAGFNPPEDIAAFYQSLDRLNLSYGPAFQTIRQLRTNPSAGQVLSRIEMPEALEQWLPLYSIHPTVLDACFQSLIAMLDQSDTTYLPTGFSEMCLYSKQLPAQIWCLGEITEQTDRYIDCDLSLLDDDGNVLATIRSMRSTAAAKKERTDRFGDPIKRQILTYNWGYGETLTEPKRLGYWLVVGSEPNLAKDVMQGLENYGAIGTYYASVGSSSQFQNGHSSIKAGSVEDAKAVLERYSELDGIVFLQGLSATPASDDPTGETALSTLVAFSQALAQQSFDHWPRVYTVTQGAFATSEQEKFIQPGQTAIGGFVRVAFNELDNLRFSTIDLPAKVGEDILENLILELLCDAQHDEVALRGNLRLVSELTDSSILADDRVQYTHLDDEHPVLIRALRPDTESVGMARILAAPIGALAAEDIRLRVESTIVPSSLLTDPTAEMIPQSVVEIVAEVIEVGAAITDLQPGTRVCGFAPSDLASHIVGPRSQFHLVPISATANATALVSTIALATRAERAIETLELVAGDTALVYADTLGLMIADALRLRGLSVALLSNHPDKLDYAVTERYPIFSVCPETIQRSLAEQTNDVGFTVLAAPMQQWTQSFDLSILRVGGCVIDTDEIAKPLTIGQSSIARTDLDILLKRPPLFQRSLHKVVTQINDQQIPALPALEVSISDIAWQNLGLAETNSRLVLTYETQGKALPVVQPDHHSFDANATYLITGGFGGFGQKTAEWLIQNGARHLVLTGRTGADSPDRQVLVQSLEALGATVKAAACDTADFQRLSLLFEDIARELPPLKGVFHSGALIIDQPIVDIDLATFGKVMQSKALGAWNLHRLTESIALDHFVLYSSVANLVGNSRQSAYSAANGFLNGLAHLRRSQGLTGTSVNWGAIADVGVVAQDEQLEQFLRYTGLRGINSLEALDVLKIGLARNVAQFGVTMITSWADWARFETRGATSPRFASLIASDSQGKDNSMRDALVEELSSLEPADQVELLASLIVEVIASVLKSDPASIAIDRSITLLGVDSLMATEIQLTLDTKLGLSVSVLELLGDATIRTLAKQSLKTLLVDPSTSAVPVGV